MKTEVTSDQQNLRNAEDKREPAKVVHAEHSGDLRKFIESGKKIIISTVQKFPFILSEIEGVPKGRHFAIIIDEAHSSQGGKGAGALNAATWGNSALCTPACGS